MNPNDPLIQLSAGPCIAEFEPNRGYLRNICLNGEEVVRCIYVHVRRPDWSTLMPTIAMGKCEIGEDSFHLTWDALSKDEKISFRWHGEAIGLADGTITYCFTGAPEATMLTNRTGLCLLHPCEVPLIHTIVHPDGTSTAAPAVETVSPTTIFSNVAQLQGTSSTGDFSLTFGGDIFEAEDQRNWTDASFKSYPICKPEKPYPLEVGEVVAHEVTLRVTPSQPRSSASHFGPLMPSDLKLTQIDDSGPIPQGDGWQASTSPEEYQKLKQAATGKLYFGARSFSHLNMDLTIPQDADGIWFACHPQVHVFDARSILENGTAGAHAIATLVKEKKPIAVSARFREGSFDPRFNSALGAAWILATLGAFLKADELCFPELSQITDERVLTLYRDLTGEQLLEVPHSKPTHWAIVAQSGFIYVANLTRLPQTLHLPVPDVSGAFSYTEGGKKEVASATPFEPCEVRQFQLASKLEIT